LVTIQVFLTAFSMTMLPAALDVMAHLLEHPLHVREAQFRQVEPWLVVIALGRLRIRHAVAHRPVLVTDAG
jgi:hypothetical protein